MRAALTKVPSAMLARIPAYGPVSSASPDHSLARGTPVQRDGFLRVALTRAVGAVAPFSQVRPRARLVASQRQPHVLGGTVLLQVFQHGGS